MHGLGGDQDVSYVSYVSLALLLVRRSWRDLGEVGVLGRPDSGAADAAGRRAWHGACLEIHGNRAGHVLGGRNAAAWCGCESGR